MSVIDITANSIVQIVFQITDKQTFGTDAVNKILIDLIFPSLIRDNALKRKDFKSLIKL